MNTEQQLDDIIKLQKKIVSLLETMLNFWKKYDESYMEEVEKDAIVNMNP